MFKDNAVRLNNLHRPLLNMQMIFDFCITCVVSVSPVATEFKQSLPPTVKHAG